MVILCTARFDVKKSKCCLQSVLVTIQGVSGGIVNILGGGSMDYSE